MTALVEMAIIDIVEGRKMFANPLDEPVFYRRAFRKWVSTALAEREVEDGIYKDIVKKALKPKREA